MYLDGYRENVQLTQLWWIPNIARSKRYEGSNKGIWEEEASKEGEKPRVSVLEAMV